MCKFSKHLFTGKAAAKRHMSSQPVSGTISSTQTLLVPSTMFKTSSGIPMRALAPPGQPGTQSGPIIHNSSGGRFILAPQQGVNLPPGQQLMLAPHIGSPSGGTLLIKANSLIPGKSKSSAFLALSGSCCDR